MAQAAPQPPTPAPPSRKQVQQEQRAAALAMRAAVAPTYESAAAGGSAWGGRPSGSSGPLLRAAPGRIPFPPGQRPVELQLCSDWKDCGECYTFQVGG